jgi:glycosyltransferase involved in cell wall biosynthesis
VTRVGSVAHLIAPAPAGGAESVVVALTTADLEASRVIVLNQVADATEAPHPLSEQLRGRGVAVDELRCGRRRYVAEVREVAALIRQHGIDLLHTHGYHATVVGYHAARRAGVPVVATVHGYLSRNVKERFYNVVDRWLLRRFDAVIAVSQGIADQLVHSGVARDKVVIVQNGLTAPGRTPDRLRARQQLGLDPDQNVVGWVGRLSPEKGADLFLEALSGSDSTMSAVVIGEGPELPRLQQMAHELNVEEKVRFAGFQPDAAQLLPAFDVLALTSRIEGTPMVILEAVAARVPIVSFAIGGIPAVLDGETAWLVPPEDVRELRVALRAALDSPDERMKRAAAAQRKLEERISSEQWVKRVRQVYDRAAPAGVGTRP